MKLTTEERDRIMAQLNDEQQDYLRNMLKRGKRTVFANRMAQEKGIVIPEGATLEETEALLDEWVYVDYIDHKRRSTEHRCECGIPLRYEHIVEHKTTGEVKRFGIDHLQMHLNLDAKLVKDIIKGFDKIDFELDEILIKVRNQWRLPATLLPLPDDLPPDIARHLELKLPLLDHQISRLRRLIESRRPHIHASVSAQSAYRQIAATAFPRAFERRPQPSFRSSNFVEHTPKKEYLEPKFHEEIFRLLQQQVQSVREICEILILKGAYNHRFSSGRPIIYPEVCMYLDKLVEEGKAELVAQPKSRDDRFYRIRPE